MTSQTAIVIGAGLSGLAAAIRLSQYGCNVMVFERHHVPGGLNSYYYRDGKVIDTGLHALTNLSAPTERSAPLNLLLRQLRIRRDSLELVEQGMSTIALGSHRLEFTNDVAVLRAAIAREFPEDASAFDAFVDHVRAFDAYNKEDGFIATLPVLASFFSNDTLRDMIAFPVMCYGNACERDMDFRQFCMLFRSMFLEGLGRPKNGMKSVLDILQARLEENGASLRLNCGVQTVLHDGRRVTGVIDAQGAEHHADVYMSCIGRPELGELLSAPVAGISDASRGTMGYAEMLFELDCAPADAGVTSSIEFRHATEHFSYEPPAAQVSADTCILCAPGNFQGMASQELRVSTFAQSQPWHSMSREDYVCAKKDTLAAWTMRLCEMYPLMKGHIRPMDMYTPRTFRRFTRRANGVIYGSPDKVWSGATPMENLAIIGTDQGYLGIVGAMMSGVAIANRILL